MDRLRRCPPWLVVASCLPARNAVACGVCTDEMIREWLPFADKLMILCLFWIIAVVIVKSMPRRSDEDVPDHGRGRRRLFGIVLIGAVGTFIIMYLLTVQQPERWCVLMISPIWYAIAYTGISPFWALPAFVVIGGIGVAMAERLDPATSCSAWRAAAWRAVRDMIVALLFLGTVVAGILFLLQCPMRWCTLVLAGLLVLFELLLALLVIRNRSHRDEGIPWRVVMGAALLSTVGFSVMFCLADISAMIPSLLIGIVWVVYVTRKVIEAACRRPCQREARVLLRVNTVFLAFAILCVPGSYAHARSGGA